MDERYSKIKPEKLLSIVFRREDAEKESVGGKDITPESCYLQVRFLKTDLNKVFKAHKHLPQKRITELTQESLIVLQGSVEISIYDLDDSFLDKFILNPGDCVITLDGGHSIKILKENTFLYEHKNGPYNGLEKDKEFINENV